MVCTGTPGADCTALDPVACLSVTGCSAPDVCTGTPAACQPGQCGVGCAKDCTPATTQCAGYTGGFCPMGVCEPTGGHCVGGLGCVAMTQGTCGGTVAGCQWVYACGPAAAPVCYPDAYGCGLACDESCSGTASECAGRGFYDCQWGCSWGPACTGTVSSCGAASTAKACESLGCAWAEAASPPPCQGTHACGLPTNGACEGGCTCAP